MERRWEKPREGVREAYRVVEVLDGVARDLRILRQQPAHDRGDRVGREGGGCEQAREGSRGVRGERRAGREEGEGGERALWKAVEGCREASPPSVSWTIANGVVHIGIENEAHVGIGCTGTAGCEGRRVAHGEKG